MEMLAMILLVLCGGAAIIALLTAVRLLAPGPVQRAGQALEAIPSRAFLLGLVNLLFLGALALGLGSLAALIEENWLEPAVWLATLVALLSLLVILFLAALALVGLSALASLLGTRMGAARKGLQGDLKGGLLLVLACLAPYIGWFLFLPAVVFTSVGASAHALFRRDRLPVKA
jgi:hypothetical protein